MGTIEAKDNARDMFAALAMMACIANQTELNVLQLEARAEEMEDSMAVARRAYEFADAMLAMREE